MNRDDERIASPEEEVRVPWSGSARPVPRLILQPLQTYLRTEEASGILLLAIDSRPGLGQLPLAHRL
jgi:hypothetical protein